MKKIFIALLIPLVVLCGCGKKDKIDDVSKPNTQKNISAYFPFVKDKIYAYMDSSETKDEPPKTLEKTYAMYVSGNVMQQKVISGINEANLIYVNENGKLKSSNVAVDAFHLENLCDQPLYEPVTIDLQEPLEIGNKWKYTEECEAEITSTNSIVETPYKSFDDALECTLKFSDDTTIKNYYVAGIGLVKTIREVGQKKFEMSLSEIIDGPFDINQTIYLPNPDTEEIQAKGYVMELKTNDNPAEKILRELQKNELIVSEAKINNLTIDRSDLHEQKLYIDFEGKFIDLGKVGASGEYLTLQCIAKTFGSAYGADKVKFTVAGNNYSSGHIEMGDGDFFDVE